MPAAKKNLFIITGLTASGKTDLAVSLCRHFSKTLPLEIVCCDSMLVYKNLTVGTAKPPPEILQEIPHHCLDLVDPFDATAPVFSVGDYVRAARAAIEAISARNALPVLVGGTGLYLRGLTQGLLQLPEFDPDSTTRIKEAHKERLLRHGSCKELYAQLCQVDPGAASIIHPNDFYRISRALLVFELTQKPLSEFQKEHQFKERDFRTCALAIKWPRPILYDRINQRIDGMLESGLLKETANILRHTQAQNPLQKCLAYRHFIRHLKGEMTLEEATALTQRDSRHFAKRQATWYRPLTDIQWLEAGPGLVDQAAQILRQWL